MSRTILAMIASLGLCVAPLVAKGAVAAGTGPTEGAGGLRVTVTVVIGPTVKTGDRVTVTATVTNATPQPVNGITLLLGLVDLTPGQPVPLGLETWTMDPESVALSPLTAGTSESATWHLVMIQPGPLGIYASAMAGPDGPIVSSPVSVLPVRDVRPLNPWNVLPVAVGEPIVLLALVFSGRLRRNGRTCQGVD